MLDEELKLLSDKKFTILHPPGGSSLNCKFAASVYLWCKDEITGDIYLVVLPYDPTFYLSEKVEKKIASETPKQTAVREVAEETGIKISAKYLKNIDIITKGKKTEPFRHYVFIYSKYLKRSDVPSNFLEKSGEISSPLLIKKRLVPKYLLPLKYDVMASIRK